MLRFWAGANNVKQMKRVAFAGLALASVMMMSEVHSAPAASSVTAYNPGGLSGSLTSYTNAGAVLGMPTIENPAAPPFTPSPTPITPFEAPYTSSQLTGLGPGGSLTVYFTDPIRNHAGNPFGMDFVVYGGIALTDVNWPNGVSDGSVFGALGGDTRVSVSQDGLTFYQLNPSLAPMTEAGLPTDAAGAFGQAPNPALKPADFAGKNLSEIRALYAGSAGGTGYDLAWALDGQGQSVNLTEASYVRLDVLSGQTKIDALVAAPEPAVWAIAFVGLGLVWWRRRARWNADTRPPEGGTPN